MFRSVIFDIDGTLVDSNDAHTRAWMDALGERGTTVAFDRVRPLIGMGGDKVLPLLTGLDAESDEGKAITERRSAIFRSRYVPGLRATHGAPSLVQSLRDAGVPLGLATSARGDEVEELLRAGGVEGLFHTATSSDDAGASKPEPDIVQAALEALKVDAGDALMVGDTPYDVEAARRAGVACVALRCGGWWGDTDFSGALAVFDDPHAFLMHVRHGGTPLLRL